MIVQSLILRAGDISPLLRFYGEALGFEIRYSSADRALDITAGHTRLRFIPGQNAPYYHFAFNIPPRQIQEAMTWLRHRSITLLEDGGKALIDFPNWNAQALYFQDPAGNIVEFIARANLNLSAANPFSARSIAGLSEIGLPVPAVAEAFQTLHRLAAIPRFWGDFHQFCAAGDEHGLFIIVDQARKTWFPIDTPARAFPLRCYFSNQNRDYQLDFPEMTLLCR